MKLISWNIQWGRGVDGRVDLFRVMADARRLADFDVLCLQEVASGYPQLPGSDGADQFALVAGLLPGHVVVPGIATNAPAPGGGRRRFGNLIASRWPVRQVFAHLLPWPPEPDVPSMQRVALEATIETPFGAVRVTTTHLAYYSARQRYAQIARLRELHREAALQARLVRPGDARSGPFEHVPRARASILVGDFNCPPGSSERTLLMDDFPDDTPRYRDAWVLCHGDRAPAPTVGLHDREQWPDGPQAFDAAFVSEDLAGRVRAVQVDPDSRASDHQPLLLELD